MTGTLKLDRKDAVKLTGRLFKLRVEVNLVSNVLGSSSLARAPAHDSEFLIFFQAFADVRPLDVLA